MNSGEATVLVLFFAFFGGVFWISQMIELMRRPDDTFPSHNDKLIWAMVMIFGSVAGALVYYLAQHAVTPQSNDQLRRDFAGMKKAGPTNSNLP
jgi:Na+/proline symporter